MDKGNLVVEDRKADFVVDSNPVVVLMENTGEAEKRSLDKVVASRPGAEVVNTSVTKVEVVACMVMPGAGKDQFSI
jgi:hypothetical protein